jgi:hypothetical protein
MLCALQAMLEDKLRATDWEATNEAIEEQVARESYLQWLRDNEQRNKNMVCPTLLVLFFKYDFFLIGS